MSTWMVVEDEPEIYELLLAMFEMWGIEGVAFVDGEEAVAWIEDVDNDRFQGELPELALIDIRLPGEIDGIEVGERLRQSPVLGKVAIVMTTAYKLSKSEQAQALERTEADLWIPKPLPKFNKLQGILEKVIADRRSKNKAEGHDISNATLGNKSKPDEQEVTETAITTTPRTDEQDKSEAPSGNKSDEVKTSEKKQDN